MRAFWRRFIQPFLAQYINSETIFAWLYLFFTIFVVRAFILLEVLLFDQEQNQFFLGITRYAIAPLVAFITIFIAGSQFIQNVYAENSLLLPMRYFFTSVFRLFFPNVLVENGEVPNAQRRSPLIVIGGPGNVLVQPGNASVFRNLFRAFRTSIDETVFLRRFQTVGFNTSLNEQQDRCRDNVTAITRDGIRVVVPNITFRYRSIQMGVPTPDNPYPFSQPDLLRMVANLPVDEERWRTVPFQVRMLVSTAVIEYINEKTIDFLTAPRENGQNPRDEIRREILARSAQNLRGIGVNLIWVDIGHIEIGPDDVTQSRLEYWATPWIGNAEYQRALADGTTQALRELGRAEAEAELVLSITDALKNTSFGTRSADSVRKILISRTAQILEAMRDLRGGNLPEGEETSD
jgi:hypothetical protein